MNHVSPYYCIVFLLLTNILVRGYNKFHYLKFIPGIPQDSSADPPKTNYRKIAQIYHPDKHRPDLIGVLPNQAEGYFKLVKNV